MIMFLLLLLMLSSKHTTFPHQFLFTYNLKRSKSGPWHITDTGTLQENKWISSSLGVCYPSLFHYFRLQMV